MADHGDQADKFDIHRISEDFANTVTARLYHAYRPDPKTQTDATGVPDGEPGGMAVSDEYIQLVKGEIEEAVKTKMSLAFAETVERELKEQYHPARPLEQKADEMVKAVRWISIAFLLPIYVVMGVLVWVVLFEALELVYLGIKYSGEILGSIFGTTGAETYGAVPGRDVLNAIIATTLSVLDIILIGVLVVMVAVGGFENTIARIGIRHNLPTWFGRLDVNQLKIKVAAAIVIISSVHLLMSFMQIDMGAEGAFDERALFWTTVIHGVFVLSAVALTAMEWMLGKVKS